MSKQLELSKHQLRKIGFVNNKGIYEIPCLNGVFYCNPKQPLYKWYQKIVVGKNANFINLDINKLPELYIVLQCFKVKFNLHIF